MGMPHATPLSQSCIKGVINITSFSLVRRSGVSQFHALCMLVVKGNAYLKRNRFQPDVPKSSSAAA